MHSLNKLELINQAFNLMENSKISHTKPEQYGNIIINIHTLSPLSLRHGRQSTLNMAKILNFTHIHSVNNNL